MNLKHLTDDCLLSETQKFVREERELLATILHHFREIERRRLYDGHSSLFAYATKVLGYSEDQAYRRIAAMRVLKELPELEEKIESGEINLSHVGIAQSLFKTEKKSGKTLSAEKKMEVFEAMAGQTTREAQKAAISFASEAPKHRDLIKPLGHGRNSVTLELSDETLAKLEKLKGLLAHSNPDLSIGDLVDRLCDLGLEEWNPARESSRRSQRMTKAEVRRQIWARDGGACVCCKSHFAVQEDHIIPESMGGEYTVENMRLLCRPCNQRAAIEKLGLDKMEQFLDRDRAM